MLNCNYKIKRIKSERHLYASRDRSMRCNLLLLRSRLLFAPRRMSSSSSSAASTRDTIYTNSSSAISWLRPVLLLRLRRRNLRLVCLLLSNGNLRVCYSQKQRKKARKTRIDNNLVSLFALFALPKVRRQQQSLSFLKLIASTRRATRSDAFVSRLLVCLLAGI